jgi:tetratricopeptide (TPR) repeat protein
MIIKKTLCSLILALTLNSCKGQDENQVKYKTDTNDIIFYENEGIREIKAKSLFNEGLESVDNQDFEKAKEKFIQADEIESKNPIILNGIAQAEFELGNVEKSNEISLYIISLDSTYVEAYSNLGRNYLKEKKFEKAKDILTKGVKFINNDLHSKSALMINLSLACVNLNDCINAVKYSSEVIKISQNEKITDLAKKIINECEARK